MFSSSIRILRAFPSRS